VSSPRLDALPARALMFGRGRSYAVQAEGLPLSLKCIANGRARYVIGRNEFAIDDGGWLIVNEDQPYTIEIASPTEVETFIVWFPRGWAEEVYRSATAGAGELLDDPTAADEETDRRGRVDFFARYTMNEHEVAPRANALRHAWRNGARLDEAWWEERLRELLAAMIGTQRALGPAIARLPALRAATRDELWRRLNRARDFAHARCDAPLSLSDLARAAAMSPYHFLRAFKAAFHTTPHGWLAACRLERAKCLLARTELPVTAVCPAVGFESLGSFGTWFQRGAGCSPRTWRQRHGARAAIRNFREVFPPPVC
jgi:AraC family transcriptional regulator